MSTGFGVSFRERNDCTTWDSRRTPTIGHLRLGSNPFDRQQPAPSGGRATARDYEAAQEAAFSWERIETAFRDPWVSLSAGRGERI